MDHGRIDGLSRRADFIMLGIGSIESVGALYDFAMLSKPPHRHVHVCKRIRTSEHREHWNAKPDNDVRTAHLDNLGSNTSLDPTDDPNRRLARMSGLPHSRTAR